MKNLCIAVIFVSLSYAAQASGLTDFKCYVGLSNGEPLVTNQFAKTSEEAKKLLFGRFIIRNKRRLKINYIQQCVTIQAAFKSSEAQYLDSITAQ